MIITTRPVTADGVEIHTGLVAYDNNLSVVVVTGPAKDGWFPTVRIGGYGEGREVGSSDATRLSCTYRDYDRRLHRACDEVQEVTPEVALRHGKVLWTLVTVVPRARFARPVGGAVVGTWIEASQQAATLNETSEVQVWYVPAEGSIQHPEDRDNILLDSGRRLPIKWDAKPLITV